MKTINKIRDFIAKGETEKAVSLLVQYTKEQNPTLQNDAVLLSSRFQQWKRNATIGINESSNDLRHIENGILTLLENSSTNSNTTAAPTPAKNATTSTSQSIPASSPPSKSSNLMPIVIGLLGLGALMMMGFWMFGDDHTDNHKHAETTTVAPKSPDTNDKVKPVNSKPTKKPVETKSTTTTGTKVTKPPITKKIPGADNNINVTQQSPTKKLPKVNGRNVNLIEVNAGLYYRHMGNKKWLESEKKTLKGANHFVETARDDYSVYLYDKARDVNMQIDLYRKKMTYADRNTKKRDQFDVVNAMEKAKGIQVIKTEYAKGYFAFKTGKTWEEKEKGTNKMIDTFTETGRDEWSVYLTNKGKDIQLNLNTKKVMYNTKGKSLAPLYDITAVY